MRVLHVTPSFAPAWSYGGLPRIVAGLAAAQRARGYEVSVATTDVLERTRRRAPDLDDAIRRQLGLERLVVLRNLDNRAAYHLQAYLPIGPWGALAEAVEAVDLVHLHGHRNLLELVAAGLARRAGVPMLFTPNGTAVNIEARRLPKALFDLAGAAFPLRSAGIVTAVSEAEARDLRGLGVRDARLRVVPNGLDPGDFEALPPYEDATPTVLYLGKITPRKELGTLIRAVARSRRRLRLRVAGNDMGGGDGLRRLAADLGVDAEWLGPVDDAGRTDALARCHVVVYAGWGEAFGLSAFEAMLAGRPVIAATDHGCGEWVEAAGGGWVVPPRHPSALAQTLERVLADPDEAGRRADAGAAFVRREFAWPAVAKRYERHYQEICPAAPKRRAAAAPKHAMTASNDRTAVSVVLPVRNGMRWLPALFDALRSQRSARARVTEVVAVDSWSDDGSPSWLEAQPEVTLLSEDPRGFHHGRVRNRAVREARGELVVFLSQDARPLGSDWLDALVAPLLDEPRVAAAYSRQVPYAHHDPLARGKTRNWLTASLTERCASARELAEAATPSARREAVNYDHVSACARRSLLLEAPLREEGDSGFGEDLAWALGQISAGRRIVYAPGSVVRHSHRTRLRAARRRAMLDHASQRRLFGVDVLAQHRGGGALAPLRHWVVLTRTYGTWLDREMPPGPARAVERARVAAVAAAETLGIWECASST